MPQNNTPADMKGQLARAVEADKELADTVIIGGHPHEVWKAGDAVFVVMAPPDKGPPRIRTLIEDRREAMLSGSCPLCNAVAGGHYTDASDVNHAVVRHDDDCLLTDENLGALIRRSYGKVKRNWWSRGVWDAAS